MPKKPMVVRQPRDGCDELIKAMKARTIQRGRAQSARVQEDHHPHAGPFTYPANLCLYWWDYAVARSGETQTQPSSIMCLERRHCQHEFPSRHGTGLRDFTRRRLVVRVDSLRCRQRGIVSQIRTLWGSLLRVARFDQVRHLGLPGWIVGRADVYSK